MRKKAFAILIFGLMMVGNLVVLSSMNLEHEHDKQEQAYMPRTTHAPIRIDKNTDFTAANGVNKGTGTPSDPYIISDLVINAAGKGAGIYIGNVSADFIIKNCTIYGADTGNIDNVYNPMAGIVIYNVQNSGTTHSVGLYNNTIYGNSGYGVYVYGGDTNLNFWLGSYAVSDGANRIYQNGIAGIYINNIAYDSFHIQNNMIFRNGIGLRISNTSYNSQSEVLDISYNGIGMNTREGLRIENSKPHGFYFGYNILYKNNGATDRYDENHPQATEDSECNESVFIYSNFWYDWAMNNNTNYDKNTGDMEIPWSYRIPDVSDYTTIRNIDSAPLKGLHHYPLRIKDFSWSTLGGGYGFVGWNTDGDYIMSGLELNGTSIDNSQVGYGLFIDGVVSTHNLIIDGLIIHNVSTTGSAFWGYQGNGLIVNNTGINAYVKNLDVYNCHANGIAVDEESGWVYVENTWVHDGASGSTGVFAYHNSAVKVFNSTIEHQGHWGVFIGGNNNYVHIYSDVISYNYGGINMPSGLDSVYLWVYQTSFFKNSYYAVSLKNSTNSWMDFGGNIFYENHGSVDSYNPAHVQVYAEKYSNFTNYGPYGDGNYYHDWANNNRSNDMNGDGVIDWGYEFDGGNIEDNHPVRWVNFTVAGWHNGDVELSPAPIYMDITNRDRLRTFGTAYGVVGYDGSYYYIVGWNKTENYTYYTGYFITSCAVYLGGDGTKEFKIYNVRANGADYGIDTYNVYQVDIEHSAIYNNKYYGTYVNSKVSFVSYNEIHDNMYGLRIDGPAITATISENRIYRNSNYGIYMYSYNPSLGAYIEKNYVFGNDIGIYGENSHGTTIENNGISYNSHYGIELKSSSGLHIYGNKLVYNNGTFDYYDPVKRQAYDDGINYWNSTTEGNYWYDWALNNDTNDANRDWIDDYPYPIYGGSTTDYYPYILMKHNPIHIDGIGELDWEHGYIGGDGSYLYAYLIAGLRINGSGAGYGLYVGNISSNVHFKITHLWINYTSGSSSGYIYKSNSGITVYNFNGGNMRIYNITSVKNYNSGIIIDESSNITIEDSNISGNDNYGIYAQYISSLTTRNLNCSNNGMTGISIYNGEYVNIYNSVIGWNYRGIEFSQVSNGYIEENNITENTDYGIYFESTTGFHVYKNNFTGNHGASEDCTYSKEHVQAYDDGTNYWNSSTEGNYWSDYDGSGEYAIDGGSSVDEHPNGCATVPEFGAEIVMVLFFAVSIVLWRRKH